MKKTALPFSCFIVVWFGLLTSAAVSLAGEGGLGGEITIGGGYARERPSQLDVTEHNKSISRLDELPDTEYGLEPFLSGELHFTLENLGTTLFLSAENDAEGLTGGVIQPLGDAGQISVAALYGEEEVWKDPYLTGVKRHKSDKLIYGITLSYEEIFGTGAFISSAAQVVDVDEDEIGEREESLRRDGYRSCVETGYSLALNSHSSLTPSVGIESNSIKGDANANDGASFGLTYQGSLGPWSLEAGASIGHSEYRKTHPVFAKKRRASAYDLSAKITYAAPFGWSPVSLYTLAAYHRVEENITFFDSETWMAGLGVGITF
jgi:hypothetical protein